MGHTQHLKIAFVFGRKALVCIPNILMPRTSKVQVSLFTMRSANKQELETIPSVSSLRLLIVTRKRIISRM